MCVAPPPLRCEILSESHVTMSPHSRASRRRAVLMGVSGTTPMYVGRGPDALVMFLDEPARTAARNRTYRVYFQAPRSLSSGVDVFLPQIVSRAILCSGPLGTH